MVPYMITAHGGLTFVANGKPISVANDHEKFDKLVEKIKAGATAEELMAVLEEEKRAIEEAIRSADGVISDTMEIKDGILRYNGEPLHLYVANKLVEMVRQGFDASPIAKFIEKLMQNPSYRAVQDLYKFLEYGGMPITPEGNFVAYKAVRQDFLDIHSATFDNSPGKEVSMPRNQVDEDPTVTCSRGLHVCSFEYLPHFAHANGHIVEVEVSPADVVAIPADYNNTKMRVCRYSVIREYEGYYKEHGDRLRGTAVYMDQPFAVETRHNDDDDFEVVEYFDSLSEAAAFYEEDAEAYQVRLVNTSTGKVLDERTVDSLYDADYNDGGDSRDNNEDEAYIVRAYNSIDLYQSRNACRNEDGFGDEDDAKDRARELMDEFPIVQVIYAYGDQEDVVKTYGYTG